MKTLLIAVALFVVGCASTPTVAPPATQALFKARTPVRMGQMGPVAIDVQGSFYTTLAGCQGVLTGFEQQSIQAKYWGVGMQLAGAVAGSVLLPIAAVTNASRTMMTLWGSIAGFTNSAVSVVKNEALDAASILSQRASVTAAMQLALTKFYAAQSSGNVAAAMAANDELAAACVAYYVASPSAAPIVPGP